VPMDGFHLDNRLLDARGIRGRKGAPDTFDAEGFARLVPALKDAPRVIFPLFDRARDIAIAGAGEIDETCDCALVEGNYLLLDRDPWRRLAPVWDLTIRLQSDMDELRRRLIRRWLDHGLSEAEAAARADGNDLTNARLVATASRPADLEL
jgi:pantothenate kinase